ncbi:MAG: hypothetical protein M1814_006608 [Vezdaea aestivalis]|nr:MAG: hypothetical protein M1814_006608 [Vezdaea aestivalis]
MFVQYFAEQGQKVVKAERKPRRNIQYKDLATVVSRIDNLEFLSGVVPRTVPYKQYKERKAKEQAAKAIPDWIGTGERSSIIEIPIRNGHVEPPPSSAEVATGEEDDRDDADVVGGDQSMS